LSYATCVSFLPTQNRNWAKSAFASSVSDGKIIH